MPPWGRLLVAGFLIAAGAGTAHARNDGEVQILLRLGYAAGTGWTMGPGVQAGAFFTGSSGGLAAGGAASVDLSFTDGAPVVRFHLGPELLGVLSCPVIMATVGGGVAISSGTPGNGWQLGLTSSTSVLVAAHPYPAGGVKHLPEVFAGPFFRYARGFSGEWGGPEGGVEGRVLFVTRAGICGGN